jgi:hypothetical protein
MNLTASYGNLVDFTGELLHFGRFYPGVMTVWWISVGCHGGLVDFIRALRHFVVFQLGVMAV